MGQVWNIGVELDGRDRSRIETTTRRLMETEMEMIQTTMDRMSKLAWDGASQSGTSYYSPRYQENEIQKIN